METIKNELHELYEKYFSLSQLKNLLEDSDSLTSFLQVSQEVKEIAGKIYDKKTQLNKLQVKL